MNFSFPFSFTVFTKTVTYLVYSPLLCITIVFHFSWDDCNTQEELKTMVYCKILGG